MSILGIPAGRCGHLSRSGWPRVIGPRSDEPGRGNRYEILDEHVSWYLENALAVQALVSGEGVDDRDQGITEPVTHQRLRDRRAEPEQQLRDGAHRSGHLIAEVLEATPLLDEPRLKAQVVVPAMKVVRQRPDHGCDEVTDRESPARFSGSSQHFGATLLGDSGSVQRDRQEQSLLVAEVVLNGRVVALAGGLGHLFQGDGGDSVLSEEPLALGDQPRAGRRSESIGRASPLCSLPVRPCGR